MIRDNARSDERPNSLLTKPEREYLACLQISQDALDALFRDDANKWAADLEVQKQNAAKIQEYLS